MQCEFTNELRTYREDIQIICNHIAVENQTYFLFRPGSIQSAVGHISERLFCTFACAVNVLFALGVGMFMAIINYPIYKGILGSRRKKYADKIIALSDKIMNK